MNDAKHTTFQTLNKYPLDHEFKGIDLQREVCHKVKQTHYPDTILRYMREWRKANPDFNIVLKSKRKSIYQKVKKCN